MPEIIRDDEAQARELAAANPEVALVHAVLHLADRVDQLGRVDRPDRSRDPQQ